MIDWSPFHTACQPAHPHGLPLVSVLPVSHGRVVPCHHSVSSLVDEVGSVLPSKPTEPRVRIVFSGSVGGDRAVTATSALPFIGRAGTRNCLPFACMLPVLARSAVADEIAAASGGSGGSSSGTASSGAASPAVHSLGAYDYCMPGVQHATGTATTPTTQHCYD